MCVRGRIDKVVSLWYNRDSMAHSLNIVFLQTNYNHLGQSGGRAKREKRPPAAWLVWTISHQISGNRQISQEAGASDLSQTEILSTAPVMTQTDLPLAA